jgi:hypothetical protein
VKKVRLLLSIALLLANGCANCGKKDEPEAAPSQPEPPVVVHPKLPDGGRGRARIIDFSERSSPFADAAASPDDNP